MIIEKAHQKLCELTFQKTKYADCLITCTKTGMPLGIATAYQDFRDVITSIRITTPTQKPHEVKCENVSTNTDILDVLTEQTKEMFKAANYRKQFYITVKSKNGVGVGRLVNQ